MSLVLLRRIIIHSQGVNYITVVGLLRVSGSKGQFGSHHGCGNIHRRN